MIAAGEIEFGSMYWDLEDKALEFEADDARERVYTTLERMIEIGGR